MTSSKKTFISILTSVARKIMPLSSKSSSGDSTSESSKSKGSGSDTRRYRSSSCNSYEVYEISESDFDDLKPDLGNAFCLPDLPAPCTLPGGPFPIVSGPMSTSAARVREWQLRELELWPPEMRPKNRLWPHERKLAVVPGRPWGLSTVWENEEVIQARERMEAEELSEQILASLPESIVDVNF